MLTPDLREMPLEARRRLLVLRFTSWSGHLFDLMAVPTIVIGMRHAGPEIGRPVVLFEGVQEQDLPGILRNLADDMDKTLKEGGG